MNCSVTKRLIFRELENGKRLSFAELLSATAAAPGYLTQLLDKLRKKDEIVVEVTSANEYFYSLPA